MAKRTSNAQSRKEALPVHQEREDGGQKSAQGPQEEVMPNTSITPLADGSIRYKVLCDGGLSPSGVYWEMVVAADDPVNAHAMMIAKAKEAKALGG